MPGFMNYPSTTQGVACVHLGLRNTAGAQALARTAPRPSPALSTLLCPSGWSPPSASPSTKASGGLPKRRVYGAAAAWEAACWLKTNPCRSFRGVRRAAEPACGEGREDAGGTERARAGGGGSGQQRCRRTRRPAGGKGEAAESAARAGAGRGGNSPHALRAPPATRPPAASAPAGSGQSSGSWRPRHPAGGGCRWLGPSRTRGRWMVAAKKTNSRRSRSL